MDGIINNRKNLTHNRAKNSNFVNELKKSMVKDTNIQVVDNLTDNFRGYAALLRKIKQRVLLAQQRVIYAANEEMLRMYWDVGEMLQQSQDADGWGKKTLQRLAVDLKNDYSEIKGFSVRNMQCMIQFFNEYNQELTKEHWQSACCCALSKEMTGIRYKFIYLMD